MDSNAMVNSEESGFFQFLNFEFSPSTSVTRRQSLAFNSKRLTGRGTAKNTTTCYAIRGDTTKVSLTSRNQRVHPMLDTMTMSKKTVYTPLDQEEEDLVIVDPAEEQQPTMTVPHDDALLTDPEDQQVLDLPAAEEDYEHARTVGAGVTSAIVGL